MAATRSSLRIFNKNCIKTLSVNSCRSNSNYVTVDVNNAGIAKVFMNKRPANAIDTDFFRLLDETFKKLDNSHTSGVILASSVPNIFSAGLDIRKMSQMRSEDTDIFTAAYYDCWKTIYEFSLPTAAAIAGHAPALGCLLASLCEYRVMVEGCGNIGMNEVAFGLAPDPLLVTNFRRVVPPKVAESALLRGRLFSSSEALQIGLVDELAKDNEEAIAKCEGFIKSFTKIALGARGDTKKQLRQSVMRTLDCPSREEFIKVMSNSTDTINKVFSEYSKKFKSKEK